MKILFMIIATCLIIVADCIIDIRDYFNESRMYPFEYHVNIDLDGYDIYDEEGNFIGYVPYGRPFWRH